MNIINIYENYNSYFKDDLKAIFDALSKIAQENDYKLYLIGGIVRDLLLSTNFTRESKIVGQSNCLSKTNMVASPNAVFSFVEDVKFLDIDISVEGDAIKFASLLKEKGLAAIVSIHKAFGTVKVKIGGIDIDFASTRNESYPKKGHLPHVCEIGCSLEKDVMRRDFTVNSLALSLNRDSFADLIDYVNGYEDLKNKKIKILHEKSFIDDPTRIIRALKYSVRLGFELDGNTLKLQSEYLKNINCDMGYKRIKQEIRKTFEDCTQECFARFIEQKIYKLINPKFLPPPGFFKDADTRQSSHLEALIKKYKPKHPWLVYFGIVAGGENLDKFELTKQEREVIEEAEKLKKASLYGDFEIYKALSPLKTESLLILVLSGKEKEVTRYLESLRKIKLHIGGKDLIELGLAPSKKFNEGFDYVLKKKLDNPRMTKQQELELIKQHLN